MKIQRVRAVGVHLRNTKATGKNKIDAISVLTNMKLTDVNGIDTINGFFHATAVPVVLKLGDIGGGNQNPLRSNIPLQWMLQHALDAGVPVDMEKAKQDKYRKIDPGAKISENKDVQIDPRRKVFANDDIDASAQPLKLAVGVEHTCTVWAELKYNWSGVALEKGGKYKVSTAPGDKWADDEIIRGPEGWATFELDPVDREFIKLFESRRRHPHGNWMELIGSYGDEDDHLIRLGDAEQGCEFEAEHNADLYLFANDLKKKYANNSGDLKVTITRTA